MVQTCSFVLVIHLTKANGGTLKQLVTMRVIFLGQYPNSISYNLLPSFFIMNSKPDSEKFEKITRHLKTPNMEMICGIVSKEERLRIMTNAIKNVENEEQAQYIASYILELQQKLKECEERKNIPS